MDKRNRRNLAVAHVFRSAIETVFEFFVGIYLYQAVGGDFNVIIGYSAYGAVIGLFMSYFILKFVSSKNAKAILWGSFVAEFLAVICLILLREQVILMAVVVRTLETLSSRAYYAVYEVVVIRSSKNHSTSSYVAGVSILSTLATALIPAASGWIITEFSYAAVFVLMAILSVIAAVIVTKVDYKVVDKDFRPWEFWQKAKKRPNMRRIYLVMFLRRLCSTDGVLKYLISIMLFLALGTEFSAGSYNSLFSVVYIIMMEVVRVMNRRQMRKRFYVPVAVLMLASAATMVANFNMGTILTFYFLVKTAMAMVNTETSGAVYGLGLKEKLANYTREHNFVWNVFLAAGCVMGNLIAWVVYNYFYSEQVFATVVVVFMAVFVVMAGVLQKVERKLV